MWRHSACAPVRAGAFQVASRSRRSARAATCQLQAYARSFSGLPEHEVVGLPALSPTMEVGNIGAWRVSEGDAVGPGDVICEVETDKAKVDFEATDDAFIAKILVDEGASDVPVGSPILIMVEDADDLAAFANYTLDDAAQPAAAEAPAPAPAPAAAAPAPAPAAAAPAKADGDRVFASPKARMLAHEGGLNISQIPGTGPRGRVLAADVTEYVPSAAPAAAAETAAAAPAAASVAAVVGGVDFTDFPLDEAKQARAAEFVSSKQSIPHYYLTIDMNVEGLLNIRADLNDNLADEDQLSTNDFFVKASALAMKKVPDINASWQDTFVRQYNSVNTSLTVGDGLHLPVVSNTDTVGLFDISKNIRDLMGKVQDGQLTSADVSGGTFSVTNLGMYGVKTASSVINSPQAAHLTIGTIEKRIIPNDDPDSDEIYREAFMVTATLSCDHRVVDGAVGATWLQTFKKMVEDPVTMLL